MISYYDPTGAGQTVAAGTLYTIAFTAKTDIAADSEASFELKKEKVRDTSRNEITGDAVDVPADKATLSVTVQTGSPTIALGDRRAVSARVGQEIEVPVYFNDTPTVGMVAFIVEFDSEKLSYASASSEGGIAENNVNVRGGRRREPPDGCHAGRLRDEDRPTLHAEVHCEGYCVRGRYRRDCAAECDDGRRRLSDGAG